MPFNSEGAGRSKTLRLLSHRQGYCSTHEVLGGVFFRWFFPGWILGGLGGPGPPLRANFGGRGPESRRGFSGSKFLTTPKNRQKTQNGTAAVGLPGTSQRRPSGPCRGLPEILHKTFQGLSRHLAGLPLNS